MDCAQQKEKQVGISVAIKLLRFTHRYAPLVNEDRIEITGSFFGLLQSEFPGLNDETFSRYMFYLNQATDGAIKLAFLEDSQVVALIHEEDPYDIEDRVLAEISIPNNFANKLKELEILYLNTESLSPIVFTEKGIKRTQGGEVLLTKKLGPIDIRLLRALFYSRNKLVGKDLGGLIDSVGEDVANSATRSVSNINKACMEDLRLIASKKLILNDKKGDGYYLNYMDYSIESLI